MNKRKKSLAVFSSVFLLITVILGFIKDIALIQFDMQNYETNLIKGHILGIVYLSISLVWAILLFISAVRANTSASSGGGISSTKLRISLD